MDAGQVRIVYHHFIVVGQESVLAAGAAECAGDQGAFFPYHDVLFENQGPENAGYLTNERLAGFADRLVLDTARFSRCLESNEHVQKVIAMTREAQAIGVRATPTVLVNGRLVENPLDAAELKALIRDELARGS